MGKKRFDGHLALDVRDSIEDWSAYAPPKARDGAPNVLYIVWDDVGFGAFDCFGGLIETPNMTRIAKAGLRFSQFHTTALCSPTRSCLLNGRNATSTGMACISEFASGYPASNGRIPFEKVDESGGGFERRGRDRGPGIKVAGVVTALKLKNTKKGDRYASFILEEGLPIVRSTPTGVSAVIDAYGRVVPGARLGLGQLGVIDAALPPALKPTVYGRVGDLPFVLLLLASALPVLAYRVRRPR